jgi:hypothetical protein|tara:strand:+ start:6569 stop:6802 length:234 start_codon:yes stop_codon:yes gene_type:complete
MSKYVPVKGYSGLVRDTQSNALINVDTAEIEQARQRKRLRIEKRKEESDLKTRVENVENTLTEIKTLLRTLLDNSYK